MTMGDKAFRVKGELKQGGVSVRSGGYVEMLDRSGGARGGIRTRTVIPLDPKSE